jgi:putative hemolysin
MAHEIAVVLLLIAANGVLAGAEIAVLAVRSSRLRELVARGRPGARAVQTLRDDPERFLATVQVGITVVGSAAAVFGGASVAARLTPLFAEVPSLSRYAEDAALAVVVVLVSYLSLIFGELVPKSLALRSGERYALLVARPLQRLAALTRPVVRLLTASSNLVLKPFGDATSFAESRVSPDELRQLVDEAAKTGALEIPHPGTLLEAEGAVLEIVDSDQRLVRLVRVSARTAAAAAPAAPP